MKLVRVALLLSCAFSASAQVTPVIDCWREDTAKGQLTVVFGYVNAGAGSVTFPAGPLNYVAPTGHVYTGQPTVFQAGTFSDVFRIAVPIADEANVSWTVNGATASLDRAGVTSSCTQCLCPAGDTGPEGPMGQTGAAPPGDIGPIGPQGTQGPTGPTGAVGATGPAGDAGPTGPGGIQGPQGPQGPAGPAGATGAMGAAGPAGATGAMGNAGPAGDAGPMGAVGVMGIGGSTGPAGNQGAAGPAGEAGAEGAQGPQGPMGPMGPAGLRGAEGPRGEDGAPAVVDSFALGDASEFVLASSADVVVLGSIAARAQNGGFVRLRLAGESFAMRVPAGAEWLAVPLHAGKRLRAGRWRVAVEAGPGVEVRHPSLSVLVAPASESGRRRSMRP